MTSLTLPARAAGSAVPSTSGTREAATRLACPEDALFVLAQGGGGLHATGCRSVLPPGPLDTLAERVASFFAAPLAGPGLLVGTLPFDPAADDALYQPQQRLAQVSLATPGPAPALAGAPVAEPAPADYAKAVSQAISRLQAPRDPLQKVVLARSLQVQTRAPLHPMALAARLGRDPAVATYVAPLPVAAGSDAAWLVGATPELLLSRRGMQVVSHPLAGSARRMADPVADRAAAEALLASRKDLDEHRYVVDAIVDALAPWCVDIDAPQTPALQATASMWHLGTPIRARLKRADTPAAVLLAALHPTPAVCGTPREQALELIDLLEPQPRGSYAGAVGWLDAAGDGEWYVAIRCARLQGTQVRLHAGAGVVADSDPALETAETAAKFTALLAALGVPGDASAKAGI